MTVIAGLRAIDQGQYLAFDRASVRTISVEGRLHVAVTHISREQVADYLGREIPRCVELGLDPAKVYRLYRPAEELERAASTFNNIPVLSEHVPVSAEDHRPELVVGATGSDAVFNAPYLDNSLVIWSADAIEGIESGEQKELSAAYRYVAVVEAGTFKGQAYDIRMTDFKANHVALVAAGRAGPTVVVGDSLPTELHHMSKKVPSRMSLLARGALMALAVPRMALDSALEGVTPSNWKQRRPDIEKVLKAKLAQDADVTALVGLLDKLDGEADAAVADPAAVGTDDDPTAGGADPAGGTGGGTTDVDATLDATDADPCAELMSMLKGKLSPEDLAAFEAKLRAAVAPPAADSETPPAGPPKTEGTPPNPATSTKEPMITKPAMDAAIAKAHTDAVAAGLRIAREITAAETAVRPYVGEVVACDSAEGVYKSALELLGVDTKDMHPSAYRHVLAAQPKPNADGGVRMHAIAMDSQTEAAERFPDIARIRNLG